MKGGKWKKKQNSIFKPDQRKIVGYLFIYTAMICLFVTLFYNHWIYLLFLGLLLPFLLKRQIEKERCRQREQMTDEFKEFILSYSNALCAGYSIENAFREAVADLSLLVKEKSILLSFLRDMERQMKNNITLESQLLYFAQLCDIEDIKDFATVFEIIKKRGGNMAKTMSDSAGLIREKIELKQEIRLMSAAKQFEMKIMKCIPIGIMGYIRITSKGYFDPLYGNLKGVCIMTICLCIYGIASFWADQIITIEV